jgi:hypothetical protein
MATEIVNKFGKIGGWNSVTVNMLGRDLEGISELEYDDSLEIENIMGAGRMPIGQGDGNYAAKASITVLNEERLAMLEALPRGTRLQDIQFSIISTYEYNNKVYTDKIRNCRIKNNGVVVKQGDKSIAHKFELVLTHIDWNTN